MEKPPENLVPVSETEQPSGKCQHISCRVDAMEFVWVEASGNWIKKAFCQNHTIQALRRGGLETAPPPKPSPKPSPVPNKPPPEEQPCPIVATIQVPAVAPATPQLASPATSASPQTIQPSEVESLVVMTEPPLTPSLKPSPPKRSKAPPVFSLKENAETCYPICRVHGCKSYGRARGICQTHQGRLTPEQYESFALPPKNEGGLSAPVPPEKKRGGRMPKERVIILAPDADQHADLCRVQGCSTPAWTRGACRIHYDHIRAMVNSSEREAKIKEIFLPPAVPKPPGWKPKQVEPAAVLVETVAPAELPVEVDVEGRNDIDLGVTGLHDRIASLEASNARVMASALREGAELRTRLSQAEQALVTERSRHTDYEAIKRDLERAINGQRAAEDYATKWQDQLAKIFRALELPHPNTMDAADSGEAAKAIQAMRDEWSKDRGVARLRYGHLIRCFRAFGLDPELTMDAAVETLVRMAAAAQVQAEDAKKYHDLKKGFDALADKCLGMAKDGERIIEDHDKLTEKMAVLYRELDEASARATVAEAALSEAKAQIASLAATIETGVAKTAEVHQSYLGRVARVTDCDGYGPAQLLIDVGGDGLLPRSGMHVQVDLLRNKKDDKKDDIHF